MPKNKVNNNILLLAGGGLENNNGLCLSGVKQFQTYEELQSGDLVKTLNDGGVFKAAKIVGVKSAVTQSVSKTGNIIKAKFLSNSKIVILTDAPKLYVATWDGTTLGALTDITPFTPTGLLDFDELDTDKIIYYRYVSTVAYVAVITISGSPSFGSEATSDVGSNKAFFGMCALSASSGLIYSGYSGVSETSVIDVVGFTVSSGVVSFGSSARIYEYYNPSYSKLGVNVARGLYKIDSTHAGLQFTTLTYTSQGPRASNCFAFIKCVGSTVTANVYTIANIGSSDNSAEITHDWFHKNGKIYTMFNLVPSSVQMYRSLGTISGDAISFSAPVAMDTTYSITRLFNFNDSAYLVSGTTVYRYGISQTGITALTIESATLPSLYKVVENQYNGSYYAMSNDSAIKTTRFLLDTYDYIGVASRAYSIGENFLVSGLAESSNLVPGATYYIGTDGQSLQISPTTTKRIGRAVTDAYIIRD